MTKNSVRYALATAGVVAAVGAVSIASAATKTANTTTSQPPGQYGQSQCADGKWQSWDGKNGRPGPFKNQGQCISYFVHQVK